MPKNCQGTFTAPPTFKIRPTFSVMKRDLTLHSRKSIGEMILLTTSSTHLWIMTSWLVSFVRRSKPVEENQSHHSSSVVHFMLSRSHHSKINQELNQSQLFCMWNGKGATSLILSTSTRSASETTWVCCKAWEILGKTISLQWRWRWGCLSEILPFPKRRLKGSGSCLGMCAPGFNDGMGKGRCFNFLWACQPYL